MQMQTYANSVSMFSCLKNLSLCKAYDILDITLEECRVDVLIFVQTIVVYENHCLLFFFFAAANEFMPAAPSSPSLAPHS